MEEADLDFSEKRTWFLPKVVFLSVRNKKEPHSHHLSEQGFLSVKKDDQKKVWILPMVVFILLLACLATGS